ncbi:MAG: hypothetical protein GY702_11495, partial [Desulfobulbaceae bacterium]|nr:hypothetical protein [Desulfobulbaceae bacterium]
GNNPRQADWTESIAVGSRKFVETIKENLGLRAKGRKILESDGGFQLREEVNTYNANSDSNNYNIGGQNTTHWVNACKISVLIEGVCGVQCPFLNIL